MAAISELASAFVTIAPSAKGFGTSLNNQVGGSVRSSGKSLGAVFGKTFALGAGVIAAAGIGTFLKGSLDEGREAQKVGAATANVIKSTGAAANVSAKQVGNLSTAISLKTGIDDEAIQSGQNLLLTFTNVRNETGKGNDVFNQATKTLVDMSAALGTDAKGSAIQLGKALNDPVKGVSALSRVGVSFTEQQKAQIKTLVTSGKTVDAQKIILGELSKEFGGAAAATATYGDKAKVAFGNIQEQVGTALIPVIDGLGRAFVKAGPTITKAIGGIGPAISRVSAIVAPAFAAVFASIGGKAGLIGAFQLVVTYIQTTIIPAFQNLGTIAMPLVLQAAGLIVPAFNAIQGALSALGPTFLAVTGFLAQHGTAVRAVVVAILAGVAAFKIIAIAARAYAVVQGILNVVLTANPIGLIIVALVALAAGLVYAYKNSDRFRAVVNAAFQGLIKNALPVINFIKKYVPKAFAILVLGVKTYINIYKTIVVTAFNVVRAVVQSVGSFIGGAVKFFATFASGVKDKISQVTGYVKALPGKIKGFFTDLPGELKTIGGNIIDGLKEGIKAAGQKVLDAVQNIIDKIPKFIRKRLGIASPSKVTAALGENIIDGLAVGMRARAGDLLKGLGKITDKVRDKVAGVVDGLKSDFASLSDSVGSNLTGDLFSGFDTASSFLGNLGTVKGNLGSALADFKTLKGFGLPTKFLAQLFSDGGFPLIHELASDQGAAQAAGSLFGDIQNLSGQLGGNVADTVVGPKLDEQTALLKAIDAKLGKMPEKTGASVGASVNGAATGGKKKGHRGK